MKLEKLLTFTALLISAILATVFLVDLIAKIPFDRARPWADVIFVFASGLVIWQSIETLRER